jgi:alkylhydroperoxidase/carboxymuconolactone decarboxylase family protein YurZ
VTDLDKAAGDTLEQGIAARRAVLGAEHVDRSLEDASPLGAAWLEHAHRHAWGSVWPRDGLDRRTRSVITLTCLVALGLDREVALHTRAAVRNGLTPAELAEILIHSSVYVGFPRAHEAFAVVEATLRELGEIE